MLRNIFFMLTPVVLLVGVVASVANLVQLNQVLPANASMSQIVMMINATIMVGVSIALYAAYHTGRLVWRTPLRRVVALMDRIFLRYD